MKTNHVPHGGVAANASTSSLDENTTVIQLANLLAGGKIPIDEINGYAYSKILLQIVKEAEEQNQELHDFLERSHKKGSIISSLSLIHLLSQEEDIRARFLEVSQGFSKVYSSSVREGKSRQFPHLSEHFDKGSAELKPIVIGLRDSLVPILEEGQGAAATISLDTFKEDCDNHTSSTLSVLETITSDEGKRLSSQYQDMLRLYKRSLQLERWAGAEVRKSIRKAENEGTILDLDSYTFDSFLEDSILRLKETFLQDLQKTGGLLSEILFSKENAGISLGFGYYDSTRMAGLDMSRSGDTPAFWSVVAGLSKIADVVIYKDSIGPFDTLGHEATHLQSQAFGRYEAASLGSSEEYADILSCAINLIKGGHRLYLREVGKTNLESFIVFLEDELVANLMGDIVFRSENNNDEKIAEILGNKLSSGTDYFIDFPTSGSAIDRREFNINIVLIPAVKNIFESYKQRIPTSDFPKLISKFDLVIECCNSILDSSQVVKTQGAAAESGSPAAKKTKREEATSTSSSSAAAGNSEGKEDTTSATVTTSLEGPWASRFKSQKGNDKTGSGHSH